MNVELYTHPWVSGTRADDYFGHPTVEMFIARPVDPVKVFDEAAAQLRGEASALGANAVVAIEGQIDVFAEREGVAGIWVRLTGTAARLVSTYGREHLPEGEY